MKRQPKRATTKQDRAKRGGATAKTDTRPGSLFTLALQHHQKGELAEAEQLYQEVLALAPDHDGALHYLGVIACQVGRFDLAEGLIGQAVRLRPDCAEAHNNLGTALWHQGKLSLAAAEFEHALALKPGYAEAHNNLGNVLKDCGSPAKAVTHYHQALALKPGYAEAHNNLGSVLQSLGRLTEAVTHYQQALSQKVIYPEAHNNFGNALARLGRLPEAMAHYEHSLRQRPGYAEAHNNLGAAMIHQGRLAEAASCFATALSLKPNFPGALNNLGTALQSQGRAEEALGHFERAVALKPDYEEAHRNLVYGRLYHPETGLADILSAARAWSAAHADRLQAAWPRHPADPNAAHRRPKLGFVSGDFRDHVMGRLSIALLEALGRAGHAFVCYTNHPIEDALSRRFKAAAAGWCPIHGLSDDAAAAQIRADAIDILFDLSGYTADNRLLLFAAKPAPVQVTWLGYPATTGMKAMDYLLADPVLVPAAADHHYQEKIIRLPAGYHLYQPQQGTPEVAPPPHERNGFITFGSFNGVHKLSGPTIECWGRILRHVPASRLVLKAPGFTCPATCLRYQTMLEGWGIDRDRLTLIGRTSPTEHSAAMSTVDIALDSFPYTGGATTVDTLWMGTPVITLAGETMAARLSASYLTAINHAELIAWEVDQYVELAVALAHDPARISRLRESLRPSMKASPLCTEAVFVHHFEQACQRIWQRHCLSEPL